MPERDDLALRPLRESDLAYFEEHRETAREQDPYNFFGFGRPSRTFRRLARDGWLSDHSGKLLVTRRADVTGDVGWHAQQYGPSGAGRCYSIGITLPREHRGRRGEWVLRGVRWRAAQWHDLAMYSRLRADR